MSENVKQDVSLASVRKELLKYHGLPLNVAYQIFGITRPAIYKQINKLPGYGYFWIQREPGRSDFRVFNQKGIDALFELNRLNPEDYLGKDWRDHCEKSKMEPINGEIVRDVRNNGVPVMEEESLQEFWNLLSQWTDKSMNELGEILVRRFEEIITKKDEQMKNIIESNDEAMMKQIQILMERTERLEKQNQQLKEKLAESQKDSSKGFFKRVFGRKE